MFQDIFINHNSSDYGNHILILNIIGEALSFLSASISLVNTKDSLDYTMTR